MCSGSLPARHMFAVRQSETVLPQQMACLPQQLSLKPEGSVPFLTLCTAFLHSAAILAIFIYDRYICNYM